MHPGTRTTFTSYGKVNHGPRVQDSLPNDSGQLAVALADGRRTSLCPNLVDPNFLLLVPPTSNRDFFDLPG